MRLDGYWECESSELVLRSHAASSGIVHVPSSERAGSGIVHVPSLERAGSVSTRARWDSARPACGEGSARFLNAFA